MKIIKAASTCARTVKHLCVCCLRAIVQWVCYLLAVVALAAAVAMNHPYFQVSVPADVTRLSVNESRLSLPGRNSRPLDDFEAEMRLCANTSAVLGFSEFWKVQVRLLRHNQSFHEFYFHVSDVGQSATSAPHLWWSKPSRHVDECSPNRFSPMWSSVHRDALLRTPPPIVSNMMDGLDDTKTLAEKIITAMIHQRCAFPRQSFERFKNQVQIQGHFGNQLWDPNQPFLSLLRSQHLAAACVANLSVSEAALSDRAALQRVTNSHSLFALQDFSVTIADEFLLWDSWLQVAIVFGCAFLPWPFRFGIADIAMRGMYLFSLITFVASSTITPVVAWWSHHDNDPLMIAFLFRFWFMALWFLSFRSLIVFVVVRTVVALDRAMMRQTLTLASKWRLVRLLTKGVAVLIRLPIVFVFAILLCLYGTSPDLRPTPPSTFAKVGNPSSVRVDREAAASSNYSVTVCYSGARFAAMPRTFFRASRATTGAPRIVLLEVAVNMSLTPPVEFKFIDDADLTVAIDGQSCSRSTASLIKVPSMMKANATAEGGRMASNIEEICFPEYEHAEDTFVWRAAPFSQEALDAVRQPGNDDFVQMLPPSLLRAAELTITHLSVANCATKLVRGDPSLWQHMHRRWLRHLNVDALVLWSTGATLGVLFFASFFWHAVFRSGIVDVTVRASVMLCGVLWIVYELQIKPMSQSMLNVFVAQPLGLSSLLQPIPVDVVAPELTAFVCLGWSAVASILCVWRVLLALLADSRRHDDISDTKYRGALTFPHGYFPASSCHDELRRMRLSGCSHLQHVADAALRQATTTVNAVNAQAPLAQSNQGSNGSGSLTVDEAVAIAAYTYDLRQAGLGGANFFEAANVCLRRRDESIVALRPFLFYFHRAWLKLPVKRSVCYRGVPLSAAQDLMQYALGSRVHWSGITSVTANMFTAATSFAKQDGILFEIRVVDGRDVSSHSFFPTEKEALLGPNTALTVTEAIHPFCYADLPTAEAAALPSGLKCIKLQQVEKQKDVVVF